MISIPVDRCANYIELIKNAVKNPRWTYPKTIDPIKEVFDLAYPESSRTSKVFCAYFYNNVNVSHGRIVNPDFKSEVREFKSCGKHIVVEPCIEVKNAMHLVDEYGGTNYWHWMSTCFSKLRLLKEVTDDLKYLVNSLDQGFVRQSLEMAGIDIEKCVETDKIGMVKCRNLIAPSPTGDRDGEAIRFVQKTFRRRFDNADKRILILRRGTRSITNENEVVKFLYKFGFLPVRCEDISFEDQVVLFSKAKVVIAPHGAGLTNLLFVPDSAKVLELRSPKYFGGCYWKLCNHLGLDYYSLYGDGEFPKKVSDLSRDLNSNMTINMERFKKTMDIMEIG